MLYLYGKMISKVRAKATLLQIITYKKFIGCISCCLFVLVLRLLRYPCISAKCNMSFNVNIDLVYVFFVFVHFTVIIFCVSAGFLLNYLSSIFRKYFSSFGTICTMFLNLQVSALCMF